MKIGSLDLLQKVMIIAEIGNNHEGDFSRALEMLDAAAEGGAHAVKFQTIIPDLFANRHVTPERYERIKKFQLSFEQFTQLKERADAKGVIFMSTPFDLESARFLAPLVPAFKIGSPENTFYPLLELVGSFGKPVILSCGAADSDIVALAVERIRKSAATHNVSTEIALLHCVSSYPTPVDQANLRAIEHLSERFGLTTGYSDHTLGIQAAVLSVALGARIIEKHFTIDKNYSDFRDHQLSADPSELRALVSAVSEAEMLLGTPTKSIQPCEEGSLTAIRRSIVAIKDIPAQTIISEDDITWTRPGGGIAPGEEYKVIGKRISRGITRGEMILLQDLVE